jgi:hypothetical protein
MQIHTNRGQRIAVYTTFPLSSVIYSIFFLRTLAHFVADSSSCNWKMDKDLARQLGKYWKMFNDRNVCGDGEFYHS